MILFFNAVTVSQTDVPMALAGYTDEDTWLAPRGRSLPSLIILYTAALTAGSIAVQVQKNGVDVGDPAVLTPAQHLDSVSLSGSLAPGDAVTCLLTTSADAAPVDHTILAVVP